MPRLKAQTTRFRWQWWALIALLLAVRAPSLVQPAGGDQGLYGYAGQRILAGDVMYRDVWDQKPPAIAFQYGIFGQIWPGEAIAPASDLAAAAAVAWLLVILGRQTFSADVGYAAAAIFLLFGDPYLQRLSGIYVRGQCEPFVALAVTASLALLTRPNRARSHLIAGGVALAWAFWLKYNAGAYALPLAVAIWASGRRRIPASVPSRRARVGNSGLRHCRDPGPRLLCRQRRLDRLATCHVRLQPALFEQTYEDALLFCAT